MIRKIQMLQQDKDDQLASIVELENELKKAKDDILRMSVENCKQKKDIEKLRGDNELSRYFVFLFNACQRVH